MYEYIGISICGYQMNVKFVDINKLESISSTNKLIVIGGPTGVGKTTYAIELALKEKAHIFSADSRQIYREMNIGTAKPSIAELAKVTHHFIGIKSIQDSYSVGDYEREMVAALDEYYLENDTAILCGGTGLYIIAVLNGLDKFPDVPNEITLQVEQEIDTIGLSAILLELKSKDLSYYNEVDKHNKRRISRAIQVIRASGKTFSEFRTKGKIKRNFEVEGRYLTRPRLELYSRINDRVDQMIKDGLIDEVMSLLPHQELRALQTVGYKELFDFKNGKLSQHEAIEKIKQNSRRYAKRQMTWFRNQTDWVTIDLSTP